MEMNELKILAIDGNQDSLTSLSVVIADAFPKSKVFTALSGAKGIEQALAEDPDVILLDIVLPDMDGFEVCRKLKQDERLHNIPVIFLTALKTGRESRVKALEAGGDAFLYKPIDELDLTAQIRAMSKIKVANISQQKEKDQLAVMWETQNSELHEIHTATLNLLEDLFSENEARKESERSLLESEQRLKDIIYSMGDWVWEVDEDGKYIYSSKKCQDLFGLDAKDIIGKTPFDLMPPDEAEKMKSIFLQLASNKEVIKDLENWNIGKKGDRICLLTNGVPILDDDGNFKGYRGVDKDITERKRMEEALLYERSLLKALMDNSPDHIYFKDVHSRFLRMSRSHAELFGLSNPAQAEGKTDFDFFTEAHARPAFVDEQEIIKTGIPKVNIEEKETWPDSPDTWVSTTKMPLRDVNGNIIGTFGISRDITASKQAEFQILKLNRTYSVLSNINQLIVRERNKQKLLEDACKIAVEDGKFIMCWIGMVDEELGKINPVAYAGTTGDYINHLDISTSDVTSGRGPTLTAFRENEHVIRNNIEQDEQMLPWRERALALGYRSSGAFPLRMATRVIGVINFYSSELHYFDETEVELLDELAMDISFALQTIEIEVQRRKAEEALSTERNLLRTLIDTIPDRIFVKDINARFVLNNKAHLKALGVRTQEESLGKTDYDFRPKDLSDKFSVSDQKVLQTGESIIGLEEQFISASAQISWLLSTKVPLYNTQGNIIGLVGTSHDITDRKKMQNQLLQSQKVQSIGTLAGGIAHDFNNILGIILAYSSVLERVSKDQLKFTESIKSINSAVSRGAALVRQILTFARQTDISISPMSVPELTHEVVTMLQETFPKIFEFKEIFERGVPFIQADHSQIHQAILNLCVNARDAMPKGGVITMKIETCSLEKIVLQFPGATYDRYVCLSVSDTGTGIDEATKSRVFDPFFTTKELGKGTGLGLSVVYGIMQSHYGFVSVESEVGKGTTFYLYLPMPQEPRKVREEQKKELFELRGGTETILFVEDEELLRTAVQSELESSGYKVYVAVDGREAIEIYKQHENEISLILTDMGLPKKTGIDVFQQVREINPRIKIVLASGFISLEQKSELLKAGANGFIQKPYDINGVLKMVREVLDENGEKC